MQWIPIMGTRKVQTILKLMEEECKKRMRVFQPVLELRIHRQKMEIECEIKRRGKKGDSG